MRHFSHLNFNNRLKIEKMLKEGASQAAIARALRVDPSTISRELKRGTYIHLNSDLTTEERYSPDIAQQNYKRHLSEKGPDVKIGHDHEYAGHIEKKILEEGYSPGAVLGEIEEEGLKFKTKISKTTLYRYIQNGVLGVTNKDLLRKKKKKKKQNQKRAARPPRGESIENRPKEVESRETPGHWEMDCVEGPKEGSQKTLLVLTERKTRWEILILMARKTMECVVAALDDLEQRCGEAFGRIFKTITVDNGSEFSDAEGMARSVLAPEEARAQFFFCHAYCSWERGSNENQNTMVRRRYPKGFDFANTTEEEIKALERWINNYPRGIFNYKSAAKMFQQEFGDLISLLF